jgi:aspartate/methionine/tyrosine aminotransferase
LTRLLIRSGLARYLPGIQRLTDGGAAFLHYYGDKVLTAPRAELKQAALLAEPPPAETIDLSLGTPPRIGARGEGRGAREDRTVSSLTAHELPPLAGLPELCSAVAEHLAAESRLAVRAPDEVLITTGAAGALHVVLDAFINPGDHVLLFDPCSPLFSLALRAHRARVNWLPTWVEGGRLRFRLDELERALRRARLLVLCSPNNPSGGVLAPEDLEQIAWWAERHDVLVYSDESFGRFRYEGERVSLGTLGPARQRTLTTGSVSKGHGLAALRVGWIAGHRHLVRPCLLAGALRTAFVPAVCQQLATTALRQAPETFEQVRSDFAARRRYVFERLTGMGLKPDWPAGGFFFWVPVAQPGLSGRTFADKLFRERRVQVAPGDLFGPGGTGHVRLSYATEEGRLREGLGRLADFVRERGEKKRAA